MLLTCKPLTDFNILVFQDCFSAELLTAVYSHYHLLLVIALMSADKYRLSAYFSLSICLEFFTPEIAKLFSHVVRHGLLMVTQCLLVFLCRLRNLTIVNTQVRVTHQ